MLLLWTPQALLSGWVAVGGCCSWVSWLPRPPPPALVLLAPLGAEVTYQFPVNSYLRQLLVMTQCNFILIEKMIYIEHVAVCFIVHIFSMPCFVTVLFYHGTVFPGLILIPFRVKKYFYYYFAQTSHSIIFTIYYIFLIEPPGRFLLIYGYFRNASVPKTWVFSSTSDIHYFYFVGFYNGALPVLPSQRTSHQDLPAGPLQEGLRHHQGWQEV